MVPEALVVIPLALLAAEMALKLKVPPVAEIAPSIAKVEGVVIVKFSPTVEAPKVVAILLVKLTLLLPLLLKLTIPVRLLLLLVSVIALLPAVMVTAPALLA